MRFGVWDFFLKGTIVLDDEVTYDADILENAEFGFQRRCLTALNSLMLSERFAISPDTGSVIQKVYENQKQEIPDVDILNNVTIEEYSFSNFKILDTNINILVCIDETKEKSLITKESMELTLNEVNDYFKKTTYDKINLNFIFAGENSADKDSINNYNHKAESISNELFEREKAEELISIFP